MKPVPALPPNKSALIGVDGHGAPFLRAVRCAACGTVAFPPQQYGCERCGARPLEEVELAPRGTVVASSIVHVHAQPAPATPLAMAEVRLDGGPVVRARLNTVGPDPHARRVHGVLCETAPASGVLEFQFALDPP